MQISDTKLAAAQILDEECERPTIGYEDIANEWVERHKEMTPEEIAAWSKITSVPRKNLWALRQESPRLVTETPHFFEFSGTNFDLLMSLYGSVDEEERPQMIEYILRRVKSGGTRTYHKPEKYAFPSFGGMVCELPLVVEFCIRTGNIRPFFAATIEPKMPTYPLAIMTVQLEETIALNWDLFSNEELAEIPKWLASLRETADRQTYSARGPRNGPMVENPQYISGRERQANQIVKSIDGITKECQQARFWYLKGMLQRTVNLEVESDKAKVEGFLAKLGFRSDLVAALDAAERDYKSISTAFELKNCLGHLRSFIEHIHRDAAKAIATAIGTTVEDRWGPALIYLRKQNLFTLQHEEFIAKLYTLISDESVHALGADREYARLLRNVVIEYGLMFLTVLAKRGVKIS